MNTEIYWIECEYLIDTFSAIFICSRTCNFCNDCVLWDCVLLFVQVERKVGDGVWLKIWVSVTQWASERCSVLFQYLLVVMFKMVLMMFMFMVLVMMLMVMMLLIMAVFMMLFIFVAFIKWKYPNQRFRLLIIIINDIKSCFLFQYIYFLI